MNWSPQFYEFTATIAIVLAASLIVISALWPPFNWRRIALAMLLIFAAACVYLVDLIPSIRKPTQILIIAECEVIDDTRFVAELEKLHNEGLSIIEMEVLITADASGIECSKANPADTAVHRLSSWTYQDALAIAKEFYRDGRPDKPLLAKFLPGIIQRVVFAHVPAGPLDPISVPGTPLIGFIDAGEGQKIELIHSAYGETPATELNAYAIPPIISRQTGEFGVFATLRDRRLQHAKKIDIKYSAEKIGNCTAAGGPKLVIMENGTYSAVLVGGKTRQLNAEEDQIYAELHQIGDRPPALNIYFKAQINPVTCNGYASWISVDVNIDITLKVGSISKQRTIILRTTTPRGLTLITPTDSPAKVKQLAAPGWDHNTAKNTGSGLNDSTSPDEIIKAIFDTNTDGSCSTGTKGCLSLPASILNETLDHDCWFQGSNKVKIDEDRFKGCLDKTERLVLISPDANTLKAVQEVGVEERIYQGSLHVMVAAPAYSKAEIVGKYAWAPLPSSRLTWRTEPRVHLSLSRREALRRKDSGGRSSALKRQRDFLNAIVLQGSAGPSKEEETIGGKKRLSQCLPGEEFGDGGGLAWFRDRSLIAPMQSTSETLTLKDQPDPRLKGVFGWHEYEAAPSTLPKRKSRGTYAGNIVCNSPVLRLNRLVMEMTERQEIRPGDEYAPRMIIGLFAAHERLHVPLSGVINFDENGECPIPSDLDVRQNLKSFFTSGGTVIVIPVADPSGTRTDAEIIKSWTGSDPEDIDGILADILSISGARAKQVVKLNQVLDNTDLAAKAFKRKVDELWSDYQIGSFTRSVTLGDGFLSDRRDVCYPRLDDEGVLTYGCSYTPNKPSGEAWATALGRTRSAPEKTSFLEYKKDPFVSGRQQLCTSEQHIAASTPFGRGRVTGLGYSPFSRDFIAPDLSYRNSEVGPLHTPDFAFRKRPQCYQYYSGRQSKPQQFYLGINSLLPDNVPRHEDHGGLTLLQRFIGNGFIGTASERPHITEINVNSETGALVVTAQLPTTSNWVLEEKAAMTSGEDISVQILNFDRSTNTARILVNASKPVSGILKLQLFRDAEDKVDLQPTLIQVDFFGPKAAEAVLRQSTSFAALPVYSFNSGNLVVLAMLIVTILIFSPPIRTWPRVFSGFQKLINRKGPDGFEQKAHQAPLFSLEAGLSEWGMHPGEPAAIRSFGLPSGSRPWRSGDQGGAIRPSTLFSLVSKQPRLPKKIPTVRLRTASQAVNILVLIEGSGALRTPSSAQSASKLLFAARLGTFIAQAVELSHGTAEIRCIGMDSLARLDPPEMEAVITENLSTLSIDTAPSLAIENIPLDGRLVYYLVDGLSANTSHLLELADMLTAEGATLRVAAIVSDDDRNSTGLRRDPLDGSFDDDTETHPNLIIERRNRHLQDLAILIARRQAQLVVLDTAFDTRDVIDRLTETGFLA